VNAHFFLPLLLIVALYTSQEQTRTSDPYPRLSKAKEHAAKGFEPVDCFAGQARVLGKRIVRQPFSIYAAKEDLKCCGELVRTATTDAHGHFVVEPMSEGEYFAQFQFKGAQHVTKFAVIDSYQSCSEASHIEINFSDAATAKIQSFVDINDSGEPCQGTEPNCFRK
jgi:hypothetical protein